jgi:hypothetical protein
MINQIDKIKIHKLKSTLKYLFFIIYHKNDQSQHPRRLFQDYCQR